MVGGASGEKDSWHNVLEPGSDEYTNTITSVQKDNYLMEINDDREHLPIQGAERRDTHDWGHVSGNLVRAGGDRQGDRELQCTEDNPEL